MAPPPTPGPRVPPAGGTGSKPESKGIQASRLLLEWAQDAPEMASDIHEVIDALTNLIRRAIAPSRPPAARRRELPASRALDESPTEGNDEGGVPDTGRLLRMMGS
jgi:hypothetical protein